MKGWVYVISNKAMPGLVKVGHSTKDPEFRAKKLHHTGSPYPFLIEYEMLIEDPYQIEQKTHQMLSSKREAKEWFRCTAEEAVVAIKQVAGSRAIIENYPRAERDKAEALHQQKIKEQEARLAREKAEKDTEDQLRNEESAIREKFQRQIEARFRPRPFWNYWLGCGVLILILLAIFFPKSSNEPTIIFFSIIGGGITGYYLRDYFEKKRQQSTAYRALEKQRDEELAAVRWRVVSNSIDKKTTEKTQDSSNTAPTYVNIQQKDAGVNKIVEMHNAANWNKKGIEARTSGNYTFAVDAFSKTIELNPQEASAYYNRGNAYYYLGQYQRAIEDYNEAIRLKPNYANAYINRGNVYDKLGQYQRAIEDYNEAIRLKPDDADAYNNRGISYKNLGQHQRTIEDFNQAIRLKPDYANAYNIRGAVYNSFGQYQRAIEDYNEAIRLKPDDADAYFSRGFVYARLGNDNQFTNDLKIAARLGDQTAQNLLRKKRIDW
jgi:tetratricopeptide (TPR) repeat protein